MSQKDPGLPASILVTVSALQHLSNERMISLLVKESDQHSQRLNGKAAREARLFYCLRALFSSTQETCWLSPTNQVTGLFVVTSLRGHLKNCRGSPEGPAGKETWQSAGRNASTDSRRVFSLIADSESLSPRISKGFQLINLNLSTSVGSNNTLGACRDSNLGPLYRWHVPTLQNGPVTFTYMTFLFL